MVQNLNDGPVQIHGLTVGEINLALLQLQNWSDESKGLRGRAMVYDRVRADDPSENSDVVTLGVIEAGTAFASIALVASPSTPVLALAPGTSYVELSETLRQQVNFASPQSLEARLLVQGWGTEAGTGKGVAVTESDGTVIASVEWDGSDEGLQVGEFVAIDLNTDQTVQVRVKGSSATEALILHQITLDVRYGITIID